MISNGAGNSRVFELRAPMMVKNDYSDATMKCSVWQKDMDVIGAFAKKIRVPTPLFSATLPVYAAALKQRPRQRRHRRGLRRAGGQGGRQAPQGALTADRGPHGCSIIHRLPAAIGRAGGPPSLM